MPRRTFLQQAAVAAAGVTIVPRHVLGGAGWTAPSDTLNIAGVGVGGMGKSNLAAVASQNIVALCDIDWTSSGKRIDTFAAQHGGRFSEQVARATRYQDFREMLDKQKDIDAVIVATPDHTHAIVAMAAMNRGKHVYVQKPLCWSVHEARELAKKARATKVATQMGNQGHSSDDARLVNEYIAAGAIGEVREVQIWTNRPLAYWAQGIPRPAPLVGQQGDLPWNMSGVMKRLANALGSYAIPDGVAWDLFLGPGPVVDYHPLYHPHNWRGWSDWGNGAIGDMGAHLIDHPFWALNLGLPTSVETTSTPYNGACYPLATMSFYEFPARGAMPPVKLTWHDGNLTPTKPEELGNEKLNGEGGVLYIGSKGKLIHQTYGAKPRLLPRSLHESFGKPPQTLARITASHEMNWVDAAKGKTQASSPFEYAAQLTEVMLLGIVSLRAGGKIEYDGANMHITNNANANQYLTRNYRQGWSLTSV
jgi:predicted dehydrogenase